MNPSPIRQLIRLRYQLIWAKTRSRNGKIALFMTGYLLLLLGLGLFGFGGYKAGVLAVQTGQAELVAQIVLSAIFVEAALSTVVLGFGIGAVFVESELRRYPLTAGQRRMARHITGIVDPFWFLVLAGDIGLVIAMYLLGAASLTAGVGAMVLLIPANYLLARVVALIVDRLMLRKGGSVVLMALIIGLSMVPGLLASALKKDPTLGYRILDGLRWTAPFGAAAAMTRHGAPALSGAALVLGWIVVLMGFVLLLERRTPERQGSAAKGPLAWSGIFERAGALFGPDYAALVGHWLRFYTRNTRFRTMYLLTLPLAAFLAYQMGSVARYRNAMFIAAMGVGPMCGFLSTSRFAVNLFGYTGGGFRRFLVFPESISGTFRAASYASMLIGGSELLLALALWIAVSPVAWDGRMLAMLVSTGLFGLFALNGAGLWATLYNPRRGNYNAALGNDLSASGNALLIGGMLGPIFGLRYLARNVAWTVAPENWWMWVCLAAAAIAFYLFSLRRIAAELPGRRERLMALVEGKA
jgi:hypothetical protein